MTLFALLLIVSFFDDPFRSGLIALQQGDLAAAEEKLEQAGKLQPGDGRVWVALCQTYWRLDKQPEAEAAADKARALAPKDPVVLQSLSIYYAETHRPLQAARLATKDRAAALYFEAAQPLLQKQQFTEAAKILEEASPKTAQLELALGVADYALRRFDDAADAFLRTIVLEPDTEQPYIFLGRMLDQIPSRLPQVTERFAQYQAAHPSSAAGYLLHAKALDAQSGDPAATLKLLDQALALDPTDGTAHFERGIVLDRLSRFADAAAEFEKAVAIMPEDAAAHYRLARDYERLGRHEAAEAEREKHKKLVKTRDTM